MVRRISLMSLVLASFLYALQPMQASETQLPHTIPDSTSMHEPNAAPSALEVTALDTNPNPLASRYQLSKPLPGEKASIECAISQLLSMMSVIVKLLALDHEASPEVHGQLCRLLEIFRENLGNLNGKISPYIHEKFSTKEFASDPLFKKKSKTLVEGNIAWREFRRIDSTNWTTTTLSLFYDKCFGLMDPLFVEGKFVRPYIDDGRRPCMSNQACRDISSLCAWPLISASAALAGGVTHMAAWLAVLPLRGDCTCSVHEDVFLWEHYSLKCLLRNVLLQLRLVQNTLDLSEITQSDFAFLEQNLPAITAHMQ